MPPIAHIQRLGSSLRLITAQRYQGLKLQSRSLSFKHGAYLITAILAALISLTILAELHRIDIDWTSRFFDSQKGWYHAQMQPWAALNQYGTLPGLVLSVGALIGFYLSRVQSRWQKYQRSFLLVVLAVIIGPGLLVNSFFKDYWGRPRPEQTAFFGGQWEYRPVFSPGIPGRGKSFPCGHCTMGYAFLTLTVFWKRSRRLAWAGGLGALFYGSILGMARVVSGAHFPTDVLWSLGIVAMVTTALYYWILRIPDYHHAPASRAVLSHKGWLALKLSGVALLILLAFLSRRPFYSSHSLPIAVSSHASRIVVHANVAFNQTTVRYLSTTAPQILIQTKGFAFPKARHSIQSRQEMNGQTIHLYHKETRSGYHAELNHHCEILLPLHLKEKLQVTLHDATASQNRNASTVAG